jgi:two-component system cell cycle response regulator
MTARVLVVDDILPNIKLLEARLTAEYFEVLTATNGPEAIAICGKGHVDIVLLDVMMPGMNGFEVCKHLKSNAVTAHIPIVMVTALDQTADRVKGLEAGADDFLTKPIDEIALIARVRSLARLKVLVDELRTRANTSALLGLANALQIDKMDKAAGSRILLIDDRASSAERLIAALQGSHQVELQRDPQIALQRLTEDEFDLFVISLGLKDYDALRLCSQIRSNDKTRQLPLLIVADLEDRPRVLRGLDLGVNDYLIRPIDRNELLARVNTQLRHKRYADALRDNVQASIEMAVVDALTGLNNRRYLETHLPAMLEKSNSRNRQLSFMVLDIDHFKSVNDTYGHDAGDEVLRTFAQRVKSVIRHADLMCRLGGEEFVVAMPDTPLHIAQKVAERVRFCVQKDQFPIESGARTIPVTVSIGLSASLGEGATDGLFKRADKALYRSKNNGRNRVTAEAA